MKLKKEAEAENEQKIEELNELTRSLVYYDVVRLRVTLRNTLWARVIVFEEK